jgi:hypothetical protein
MFGHPLYACSLLVPFLANYILTWIAWEHLDKNTNVEYFLAAYPQSRAVAAVKLIWTNPAKGMQRKRKMRNIAFLLHPLCRVRELSEMEVFAGSILTLDISGDYSYLCEGIGNL